MFDYKSEQKKSKVSRDINKGKRKKNSRRKKKKKKNQLRIVCKLLTSLTNRFVERKMKKWNTCGLKTSWRGVFGHMRHHLTHFMRVRLLLTPADVTRGIASQNWLITFQINYKLNHAQTYLIRFSSWYLHLQPTLFVFLVCCCCFFLFICCVLYQVCQQVYIQVLVACGLDFWVVWLDII